MLEQVRPRLRIAQVAPLYESVPPKLYGGTERVVAYLTEELIRRGHDVTLFASGDSTAHAKIEATYPTSLRVCGLVPWAHALHLPMLSRVFEQAARFDIIHCHLDYWSFPLARTVTTPTITTLHGRLDIEVEGQIYGFYSEARLISVSDAQRAPLPNQNWMGTVYHGLPKDQLRFSPGPGQYLAFLGRIAPEKRVDLAIEVSRRTGIPLKIAAKVDAVDREYFETTIRPLLHTQGVEFIGEITEPQKSDFLGNAIALLFPVDWPEPFGLVMIEALACGTPIIARPYGSVPEIVRHGLTGFVFSEIDDLVAAARQVTIISRRACRLDFETRFTADVMAEGYEQVYAALYEECAARGASDNAYQSVRPTG